MDPLDDTIAAIATAPGMAGIAVVRVSGNRALAISDAVFRGSVRLQDAPGHTLHHGWADWPDAPAGEAVNGGGPARRLDEVVAAVFREPRSYTREDVVEISCHGGRMPAESVLSALISAGARAARPGEFTLRAFLNGRLDLAQAEAVADLIHAQTEGAQALAVSQLSGDLSCRIAALAERLANAVAEIEARVDFAEDVGGIEVPEQVIEEIEAIADDLTRLLETAAYARALQAGVRVPIVGRPNVGKSSLFNAMVGESRAIVTAVPGTTRDLVSEAIEIEGIRVTLFDTAGLRETRDQVESIGVERARSALDGSAVLLWVIDAAASLDHEDRDMAAALRGKRVLAALNKSDLPALVRPDHIAALLEDSRHVVIEVSALSGEGVDRVHQALADLLDIRSRPGGIATALGNLRHAECLSRARSALERAAVAARGKAPGEIVALELREGIFQIGEVTGKNVGADLLDRIFSRFCIGK